MLLAGLSTVLAACEGGATLPDAAVLDAPEAPDAALPDAFAPDSGRSLEGFSIDAWRACPGAPASATYRCAVLTVPIDWSRPDGPTITRPVRRYPASGSPGERRGVLFWNPGGPGATTYPARTLAGVPEVVAAFDVISVDWRGVGASEPHLTCPRPESEALFRYQTTSGTLPEASSRTIELARLIAEECLADLDPLLVQHVGSDDMARDLEAMRILLGEERVSFVGYSYGTVLGAAYAGMYPDRVDAFVLDAPIHPALDWLDDEVTQMVSQEAAFERFFSWCAAEGCAFARGRDAEGIGAAFDAIANELLVRPRFGALASGAENVVSISYLLSWCVGQLRNPFGWPALGVALERMERGDFGPIVATFSEPDETRSLALRVITHLDRPLLAPWDEADALEVLLSHVLPMAPRAGFSFNQRAGEELAMESLVARELPLDAPDAPPLLVIGGMHDTQTPYANAVAMRAAVGRGSHLVTYEGDGHAISEVIPCLRDEVVRFLLDPSRAPSTTRCAAVEVTP